MVNITPALAALIMAGGNALQLAEQARAEGFKDLRHSALNKVMGGVTSLAEINRVTTGHRSGHIV